MKRSCIDHQDHPEKPAARRQVTGRIVDFFSKLKYIVGVIVNLDASVRPRCIRFSGTTSASTNIDK